MTYDEAIRWLYSTQVFGIKLGLETMQRLAAALDLRLGITPTEVDPTAPKTHRDPLVPAFAHELRTIEGLHQRGFTGDGPVFIHVAGTNGKGSVCAMLDSMLREAGVRTGLYTSPHLVTFRERIRLDGEMISEEEVAAGLTRIRELVAQWEYLPTFFEIVTALALAWFQEQNARVAILETGLGGRLDATNIVTPAVCVLTEIALDHEKYLGSTLAEIAAEKAGIIKPWAHVISAPQAPEVRAVIQWAAPESMLEKLPKIDRNTIERLACSAFVEQPWSFGRVGLAGSHQRWNAELASRAFRLAQPSIGFDVLTAHEAALRGLEKVLWPGRFQRVGERFVLDGAHNPAAAQRLAQTWREEYGEARATLILGVMRDKDVRGVCAALTPIAERVFVIHVDNPRSCSAEELSAVVRAVAPGAKCVEFPSLSPALIAAEQHPERALIAGSLFLVGEALVALGLTDAKPEKSAQ